MDLRIVQLIIFGLGSVGFAILSRNAFINQQFHGFPRFFAFESILGLAILNAPVWFTNPLSLTQVISWALLLDAVFLAAHAFWTLRAHGVIDRSIQDASQVAFEKTTRLVAEGPYQFIRHPMYASLLLFTWGAFLKQPNLVSTLLAVIATLTLLLTSIYEERENLLKFGDQYAAYMQHTRRFIPFVF